MGDDTLILTNESARITVDATHGGRLSSLEIHDVELLVDREDDPVMWGCYPMVPFAGRIRGGEFHFEGHDYAVPKNFGDHAMHGYGFTSVWTRVDDHTISYDLAPPWPFAGRVEQRFVLDAQRFAMTMSATAHVRQPIVLGWHPWFRKSTTLGDVELAFTPGVMYERDDASIATGERIEPKARPWDDCFTNVAANPALSWGDLRVELASNADHWVVFDELDHAICVEPQTGPPNAANLSPTVLDEGHQLTITFSLDWSMT